MFDFWLGEYLFILMTATLLKQLDNKLTTRKLINYDEISGDLIWDDSISENLKSILTIGCFQTLMLNLDGTKG